MFTYMFIYLMFLDKIFNMQYMIVFIIFSDKKIKMCKQRMFILRKLFNFFQYMWTSNTWNLSGSIFFLLYEWRALENAYYKKVILGDSIKNL